ncbi:MAG: hypothetical protein ACN4E6_01670 [Qipengyuania pacifica]
MALTIGLLTVGPVAFAQEPVVEEQARTANALEDIATNYRQQIEKADQVLKIKPCGPSDENRHSELCAQWKSADAAAESAKSSTRAAWIGVISSVLVFLALGVALQSNKIARQTARRQLRAYVHPDRIWLLFRDNKPYLGFRIKNTGQTPAKWFEIEARVKIMSVTDESRSQVGPIAEKTRWAVIGAGSDRTAGIKPLNPDNMSIVEFHRNKEKGGEFFALGRIRYCDIFDHVWETEFTAFARPDRAHKNSRWRMTFANSNVRAFEKST